jgi:hypothetical protein
MNKFLYRVLSFAAVATFVLSVASIAQSPKSETTSAPPEGRTNEAMAWKLSSLESAGAPKPKPDSTKPKCPPPLHCAVE